MAGPGGSIREATSEAVGTLFGGTNQTAFLWGSVAAGFLFFVTVRGDLPKWLALFTASGSGRAGSGSAPGQASGAAGSSGTSNPLASPSLAPLPALPAPGTSMSGG